MSKVNVKDVVDAKDISFLPLKDLLLDGNNPRFGERAGTFKGQEAVLDYIVTDFGVDNLLPSLAYNGFFEAEPLIVKKDDAGRYVVAEGNRRLASCLILANDDRAKNQAGRIAEWRKKAVGSPWDINKEVPVKIFDDATGKGALLSYLGVRHIVASQSWDSYAKAKWIADVVENGQMTIEQISEVTGDKNKTIARLLEGY